MPEYLKFDSRKHPKARKPVPMHDGNVPSGLVTIGGVLVDGAPIEFEDPKTPEKLHRTLLEGPQFERVDGMGFDCVVFALLMAGVELPDFLKNQPFKFVPNHVSPEASLRRPGAVIDIGSYRGGADHPTFYHVLSAAPQADETTFLHKIGSGGPVALTDLETAQDIYKSRVTMAVGSFAITYENAPVLRQTLPESVL
jgi:hypothetical protein